LKAIASVWERTSAGLSWAKVAIDQPTSGSITETSTFDYQSQELHAPLPPAHIRGGAEKGQRKLRHYVEEHCLLGKIAQRRELVPRDLTPRLEPAR
jgi:hypothetical protein